MSRMRIVIGAAGVLVVAAIALAGRPPLLAQAPAAGAGDAALSALVAELRALRADLAAASRNQLRAQLLLGRVQMQEQRLAYLDKQRSDVAAGLMVQAQVTSGLRAQVGARNGDPCANVPAGEQRRDCEQNVGMFRQQLADQEARETQLRSAENDLTNALSAEQARWSDFNARLDELERSIR